MHRSCRVCAERKPLEEYYAHPTCNEGRLYICKDCHREGVRRNRKVNSDRIRAYDRERGKNPERRERHNEYVRNWAKRQPERIEAVKKVRYAVLTGRLKRLPCAFCSSTKNIQAHHHDYSKPLDVTWLCSACHKRFHALEAMSTYSADRAATPTIPPAKACTFSPFAQAPATIQKEPTQ